MINTNLIPENLIRLKAHIRFGHVIVCDPIGSHNVGSGLKSLFKPTNHN